MPKREQKTGRFTALSSLMCRMAASTISIVFFRSNLFMMRRREARLFAFFEDVSKNKCAVLRSRHPYDGAVSHLIIFFDFATEVVVALFFHLATFFVFVCFVNVRLLLLIAHLRPMTGDCAENLALLGLARHAGTHFVEPEMDRE